MTRLRLRKTGHHPPVLETEDHRPVLGVMAINLRAEAGKITALAELTLIDVDVEVNPHWAVYDTRCGQLRRVRKIEFHDGETWEL